MNPNKEYFNNLAQSWDTITNHDENKIKTILEITNLKKKSRILDIATGTGILIKSFLKYSPKEIIAIDISNKMIEKAREKFRFENVKFLEQDFYKLQIKDFDYAICYSAYPHFLDKELFIKKIYSVLVPNGRFVIAHSESKDKINNRHKSSLVKNLSVPLKNMFEEANNYKNYFTLDILIDTEELYILSGIKKADIIIG